MLCLVESGERRLGMASEFIEVQTRHQTGAAALPGPKVVIATSQIATIEAAKNNSSDIHLVSGGKLNVATSHDEMKRMLGVTS